MIRRLVLGLALSGLVGTFALTVLDIFRLSDRACRGWAAEARGNCEAFARYYAHKDMLLFSACAILLAMALVLNFRSAGK
jgi:hypothetical protein